MAFQLQCHSFDVLIPEKAVALKCIELFFSRHQMPLITQDEKIISWTF